MLNAFENADRIQLKYCTKAYSEFLGKKSVLKLILIPLHLAISSLF